jgi:hypothetical protein
VQSDHELDGKSMRDDMATEMLQERELMLADLQDKQSELFRLHEENKDLKNKNFDLEQNLKAAQQDLKNIDDPKKLKEQRDLLIDLRQKVQMYERELKLISENSGSEIDALQKQVDMYKRREKDVKLN